jgi:hypothetical protein
VKPEAYCRRSMAWTLTFIRCCFPNRMRFGLHSGPVTAGVLRGKRSRFQLFGGKLERSSMRLESLHETQIFTNHFFPFSLAKTP